MCRLSVVMVLPVVLFATGCGKRDSGLDDRVDAALKMTDAVAKDARLTELAREAAAAQNGPISKKAVAGMTDKTAQANVATECARKFKASGDGKIATELAQ